ncbi:NADP-dependent oxidoreductase [Pseudaminobacter sp. NGMCC 1.201702]|uniref:NADP-dependent oxidoreductase n=1 Tax=Pseudaminobacter sp. NGMCC 1.201702 TaxID=3391825 RepID=UPI0039F04C5F
MLAACFDDYTGAEAVKLMTVVRPTAREGELLVRVHAAGVNPFDWYAINGYLKDLIQFDLPAVLGREFSGTVAAIGAGVDGFSVGDAVLGHVPAHLPGAFAEYVTVPALYCARKPDRLSHKEAAALPDTLIAAWASVFCATTGLDLKQGQRLLVNGASGGVGSIAVQLAKKMRGASVVGTASAAKIDLVAQAGADMAIDYAEPEWSEGLGQFDSVLNTALSPDYELLCSLVRPGGRLATVTRLPGGDFVERWAKRGVSCTVVNGPAFDPQLSLMIVEIESLGLSPVIGAVMPLSQAADAIVQVGHNQVRGKAVLMLTDTSLAGLP